jgi:hypothetical protein
VWIASLDHDVRCGLVGDEAPFQHCARNQSTWALAEFETRRAGRCRLNLAQYLFGLAAYTNTGTRCQPSARKTAPSIAVQDARLHNPTQGEQLFAQVQNSRARAFAQNLPGAHTHTHTHAHAHAHAHTPTHI